MACSKCKKKELRDAVEKEAMKMNKWVILTALIILSLSVYGLYSLIVNLI